MRYWRQLKWRIVGAHMLVVVVGVALVLAMASIITQIIVPETIQDGLELLVITTNPADTQLAKEELLDTFRQSILTAVSVAALGAVISGVAVSFWLARQILRPLDDIADSSQRIAWGHYDERVDMPDSDELAIVATNFNQMASALERVEQQRVILIGNVSHELRTPLTGLNGYLEGLMDGLFPSDETTFAQMAHEVRRLRRLVDDLQALSRVESGEVPMHLQRYDIVAQVTQIVNQLRPQADTECLTLETKLLKPEIWIYADPDRVAQILFNLIGNSIRYTPAEGCIRVVVTAVAHKVQVEVQDNGIGIPAESLPYIFERFYRVDASRTRKSGGSGIGLTISRHLAWNMGGELTAVSDGVDQGSKFTLTLPLAQ